MIIRDQFKMIFRHWGRNRLNTFISFASLIVGLTCSLTLLLFLLNEYRIATALRDASDVYLLQRIGKEGKNENSANPRQMRMIADELPEVESVCPVVSLWGNNIKVGEIEVVTYGCYETLPVFADYFDLPIRKGDLKKTLSASNEVAITASYAQALLGGKEPLGAKIVYRGERKYTPQGTQYAETEKYITCVIDDSQKSVLNFQLLSGTTEERIMSRFENQWSYNLTGFVRLYPGTDYRETARKISADSSFLKRPDPKQQELQPQETISSIGLLPLDRIYYMDRDEYISLFSTRDPQLLSIGGFTALLILLIACFNYVNLTMTCAAQRLRNVAGQRILGASKWNVRGQVVLETLLHVVICFVLALVLIYTLLPDFNSFMWCDIHFGDLLKPGTIGMILLLLFAVTLLPSAYILSKLETDSLLVFLKKGNGRRSYLVKGMVIVQFAISAVLLVVCLNVFRQIDYIVQSRPLSEQLISISVYGQPGAGEAAGQDKLITLKDRVKSLASVEGIRGDNDMIYRIDRRIQTPGGVTVFDEISADLDYFDFYDIGLLAGRTFTPSDSSDKAIINQTAARVLKLDDPIGAKLTDDKDDLTVVGLVADMPKNLHETDRPRCYVRKEPLTLSAFIVKAAKGQSEETVKSIEALSKEIYGENVGTWITTAADYSLMTHRDDVRVSKMILTFTVISLLLTLMGLFGLAWYSVERRRREIALRKVHGATTGEVVGMLCGGFLRWIAISFVIAVPFAYYFSSLWFRGFAYKTDMGVWVFVATALFVGLVGVLTVLWQSWRAGRRNPAKAIKSE